MASNWWAPYFVQDKNRWAIAANGTMSRAAARAEAARLNAEMDKPKPEPRTQEVERVEFFDSESGLGIGGAGSDDFNIATEGDTGIRDYRTHKCGRGQRYDERCTGCGRVTAICNDCELCERCHE